MPTKPPKHFGPRHQICSVIDWGNAEDDAKGFYVKPIPLHSDGTLNDDTVDDHDFGYFITAGRASTRLNLFDDAGEANDAAKLLSEGTEDGTECFLVMAVSVTDADGIVAAPVGGFWQLGKRL